MRLIFKHLIRSIGKKPLQPIILILTITLAVSTAIFVFTIGDALKDDINATQVAKYGNADFTIGLGNSSDSRFLFVEDVETVLGDKANIAGCYELPMILDDTKNTVIGMATEFDTVGNVFDIEFVEYGRVTEGSLGEVAFISADLAEEQNLSVGDSLEIETMGQTKTYRIEGIAKRPFLASYDVMVDICSIVRIFANNSLVFAAIGDDFKPCSKIYVDLDACEALNVENAVALLSSNTRFEEKVFTDVRDIEGRKVRSSVLELIIDYAVALSAFISAVITFCCFYILANERAEENQTLTYSGARPRVLGAMQYAETLIYWLVGTPLGILCAIPLTRLIPRFVGLRYIDVSMKPITVAKSALIMLATCALTTAFFIVVSKRVRRKGEKHMVSSIRPTLWLLVSMAILFALMYLLPGTVRFELYIMMTVSLMALIFVAIPPLLQRFAVVVDRRMDGAVKPWMTAFRYALKNVCSLKLFHNIARLCALIVTVVLTIGLIFACLHGQIPLIKNAYNADYAVLNATDSCYEKTLACEEAESVCKFYLMQNNRTTVISAEDVLAYSESLDIERLPVGNEAIVSAGIAHMMDIRIGEKFSIDLDGQNYELILADIGKSGINYIAINCEDLGIPYNMLLVKGNDDVSRAELLGALSAITSTELASIVSVDTLLENLINLMSTYISAGEILLLIFVIFSLIGMIDTLYESSRARCDEFSLYRLAGMSKRELKAMKLSEIAIAIALGMVIGIVAFVLSAFSANRGFTGKGMELFLGLIGLFR